MDFKVSQFVCTSTQIQPDGSIHLNDNQSIRLIDVNGSTIKPRESYLITISKIASNQIIIEETQDDSKEEIKSTEEIIESTNKDSKD